MAASGARGSEPLSAGVSARTDYRTLTLCPPSASVARLGPDPPLMQRQAYTASADAPRWSDWKRRASTDRLSMQRTRAAGGTPTKKASVVRSTCSRRASLES